ncbi:Transposase, IS4 family [uncultured Leptolyngbya sp.]|uniref:Transposase, IS4 family n=1 Tax=uncultured Leptolyngbya sp. TaxID=332963 RepID=A0A6J4NWD0_9CYAN|nr:Transposase, IS4 family [uncultured Leptolyngbya sp.]
MNRPAVQENDYIEFLLAAHRAFDCVSAAATQPDSLQSVAHDAYTRLLTRRPLDPEALWNEAQLVVGDAPQKGGLLILDDTTLDKPYAQKMDLVSRHWSGKHKRVVMGINLLSLVWTNTGTGSQEEAPWIVPCDFRVYDQNADKNGVHHSKNDHFCAMLQKAKERGFAPEYVAFDSWYSGLDNLKKLRALGFWFLTRLKSNRLVNPDKSGLVEVSSLVAPTQGLVVHLKGFGFVRLFQHTGANGQVEQWATNDLDMTAQKWRQLAKACWRIESYHRALKQCCGVERAQVRSATGQKNHLLLCLRAFLRLEVHRLQSGISWYQAKANLLLDAIKVARTQPAFALRPTA